MEEDFENEVSTPLPKVPLPPAEGLTSCIVPVDGTRRNKNRGKVRFVKEAVFLNATDNGELDAVKACIEQGVSVNLTLDNGITGLHNAAMGGHFDVVKLLVQNGADIHAVDEDGWTPLHAAASGGSVQCVDLLLKKGANMTAVNGDDETPYDLAEEPDVQRLLLANMSEEDAEDAKERSEESTRAVISKLEAELTAALSEKTRLEGELQLLRLQPKNEGVEAELEEAKKAMDIMKLEIDRVRRLQSESKPTSPTVQSSGIDLGELDRLRQLNAQLQKESQENAERRAALERAHEQNLEVITASHATAIRQLKHRLSEAELKVETESASLAKLYQETEKRALETESKLEETKAICQELEHDKIALAAEVEALKAESEKSRQQAKLSLQADLSNLQDELNREKAQRTATEARLAETLRVKEEEILKVQENAVRSERQTKDALQEKADLLTQLAKLKDSIATLEKEKETTNKVINTLRETIQDLDDDRNAQAAELNALKQVTNSRASFDADSEELRSLQAELANQQTQKATLEKHLQQAREQMDALRSQNKEDQARVAQLEQAAEETKTQQEREIRNLSNELISTQAERDQLRKQLGSGVSQFEWTQRITSIEEARNDALQQLSETKERFSKMVDESEKEIQKLQRELTNVRIASAKETATKNSLDKQNQEISKASKELEKALTEANNRVRNLETKVRQLEMIRDQASSQNDMAGNEKQLLLAKITLLEERLEEKRLDSANADKRISEAQEQISSLQVQLQKLTARAVEAESDNDRIKNAELAVSQGAAPSADLQIKRLMTNNKLLNDMLAETKEQKKKLTEETIQLQAMVDKLTKELADERGRADSIKEAANISVAVSTASAAAAASPTAVDKYGSQYGSRSRRRRGTSGVPIQEISEGHFFKALKTTDSPSDYLQGRKIGSIAERLQKYMETSQDDIASAASDMNLQAPPTRAVKKQSSQDEMSGLPSEKQQQITEAVETSVTRRTGDMRVDAAMMKRLQSKMFVSSAGVDRAALESEEPNANAAIPAGRKGSFTSESVSTSTSSSLTSASSNLTITATTTTTTTTTAPAATEPDVVVLKDHAQVKRSNTVGLLLPPSNAHHATEDSGAKSLVRRTTLTPSKSTSENEHSKPETVVSRKASLDDFRSEKEVKPSEKAPSIDRIGVSKSSPNLMTDSDHAPPKQKIIEKGTPITDWRLAVAQRKQAREEAILRSVQGTEEFPSVPSLPHSGSNSSLSSVESSDQKLPSIVRKASSGSFSVSSGNTDFRSTTMPRRMSNTKLDKEPQASTEAVRHSSMARLASSGEDQLLERIQKEGAQKPLIGDDGRPIPPWKLALMEKKKREAEDREKAAAAPPVITTTPANPPAEPAADGNANAALSTATPWGPSIVRRR